MEIDGQFFTSYVYGKPILRKPVLFPVISSSGKTVTRGYPLETRPGERVDHTHHHGVWFNHGNVNGIDFWNAGRTPPKPGVRYGTIKHHEIVRMRSGNVGRLTVAKGWYGDTGELLLNEVTSYVFHGKRGLRVIAHTTTLTATGRDVRFTDSKEGLFAIRVARELELAGQAPAILTGSDLKPSKEPVTAEARVSGHYLNSEGLNSYPEVWGKRARWMQLSGLIDGDPVSVHIFDSPKNVNHPPHWMARDYGLFAVNSLGSAVYTDGAEVLNLELKKSESRTFRNQITIFDGAAVERPQIEEWYQEFVNDDEN